MARTFPSWRLTSPVVSLALIFALMTCVASPALAATRRAQMGDLNGWLVVLLIVLVLAAGLLLQSTTRRIR